MAGNPVTYEDFEFNNFGKLRSPQLIDDIVEKRLALVNVIECIGSVLTSDSKEIRGRGIDFIAWILARLPENFLSEPETSPIARYFGDRLKDHHSLIPGVIKGILALLKSSSISDDSVCEILHRLFQFVVCQSQLVQDRYNIYCVIEECTKKHMNCVQNMGPDFIFGVITAMEGETDPKNLLFIFSFLPGLLSRLKNIDHLTSDIFEVFSTYFPVDFNSVTKDGISITRENLAGGLSRCLSSTPSLAAECLPLILEKLDSSLKAARIDSYILLQQCCTRLNVSQLDPSLGALWKMIRRDLIPPGPSSVSDEALQALTRIIGVLAREESNQTSLNRFLDDVIISIRSLLPKPNDSLFIPSMKILQSLCPESKVATERVFLELEYLCKIENLNCNDQQVLQAALLQFLQFQKTASSSLDTITTFCLVSAESSSDDVRALAFIALQQIIGCLLEKEGGNQLYKVLLTSVRFESSPKSSNEFYKLLRKVAEYSPQSFCEEFYKSFFALYESNYITAQQFFEGVGFIADVPLVTAETIPHMLTCISSGTHAELALKALLFTCDHTCSSQFFTSLVFNYKLIPALVVWKSEVRDVAMLSTIGEIVAIIISHLDKGTQEKVVLSVMSSDRDLFATILVDPAKIILLEGLVGGLRRGFSLPCISDVIRVSQEIAKSCKCHKIRYSAGRLLAALVNKMAETIGPWLLDQVSREILQPESDKDNFIALIGWLMKGAILRSLPGLEPWIAKWFSYLDVPRISRSVALWTQSFLKEEAVFLTPKTHCTVKFLYRQRLFSYSGEILKCTRNCELSVKDNYFLVLIALAQNVPKAVLKCEPCVPNIVAQAMLSSNVDVVGPALELLKTLLEEKSSIFTENITSLLPAMLRFVTYAESSRVRKLALSCVFLAGFYSTHKILPYRREVVKALLPCLDDKKRVVRAEAARARSRWCLVGAVGEDVLLNQ